MNYHPQPYLEHSQTTPKSPSILNHQFGECHHFLIPGGPGWPWMALALGRSFQRDFRLPARIAASGGSRGCSSSCGGAASPRCRGTSGAAQRAAGEGCEGSWGVDVGAHVPMKSKESTGDHVISCPAIGEMYQIVPDIEIHIKICHRCLVTCSH